MKQREFFNSLLRSVAVLVHLNSWSLVAVLYGLQTIGAIFTIRLLGLDLKDLTRPLLVLLFGLLLAVSFRLFDRSDRVRSWKWWLPVITYGLFIFFLSNQTFPHARLIFRADFFHPVEYATFGLLLSGALNQAFKFRGNTLFGLCVVFGGLVYGLSDEFHQSFIPGRFPSKSDVWLDVLGLGAGFALFVLGRLLRKKLVTPSIS